MYKLFCCFKNKNNNKSMFTDVVPRSHNSRQIIGKYRVNPVNNIIFDQYNLREKIGDGGSASVYKYTDNNQIYACKLGHSKKTFEREINIMKLYKNNKYLPKYFGSHYKRYSNLTKYYIVMEYCNGRELFENLQSNYHYSKIIHIVYQLLLAVKHLQKFNIIHADIKLENIIINSRNEIKLFDFGLSRVLEDGNAVKLTNYIGTVGYASPEVLLDTYLTLKTDVWSIGVIMYMLFNNSHLFEVADRNKYKQSLISINRILSKRLFIYNNTVPTSKYDTILSFLIKTICYDKTRYGVNKCLRHPVFLNSNII